MTWKQETCKLQWVLFYVCVFAPGSCRWYIWQVELWLLGKILGPSFRAQMGTGTITPACRSVWISFGQENSTFGHSLFNTLLDRCENLVQRRYSTLEQNRAERPPLMHFIYWMQPVLTTFVTSVRVSFHGSLYFQPVDVASRARSFIHLLSVLAITFTCDSMAEVKGRKQTWSKILITILFKD